MLARAKIRGMIHPMKQRRGDSTLRRAADRLLEDVGTTVEELITRGIEDGLSGPQIAARLSRLTEVDFPLRTVQVWISLARSRA